MNLILVNHKDPFDIGSFSGISHFMSEEIKSQFRVIGEFNQFEPDTITQDVLNGNAKKILEPFGRKLTTYIKNLDFKPDYIFCQGGNISIPFYNGNIPIAYWHDSTWNSIWRNYEDNSGFLDNRSFKTFKKVFKNLYYWDKAAMDRADLIFFSSDYIAEAAIRNYKISNKKVFVIPYGANLPANPSSESLEQILKNRISKKKLILTFIGKDWQRKGLKTAVNLTNRMNFIGVPTKLNIIGCKPSIEKFIDNDCFSVIGFIDKNEGKDLATLNKILEDTHFLIHPALSEPFGIVICEANAYGIPIFGTNIDGLKTTVAIGKNGYLFNKNRFITSTSDMLKSIFHEIDEKYPPLFYSTVKEYNTRLNWKVNVAQLQEIMKQNF